MKIAKQRVTNAAIYLKKQGFNDIYILSMSWFLERQGKDKLILLCKNIYKADYL